MKITRLLQQQICRIRLEWTLIQADAQQVRALETKKEEGQKPIGKGTWKHAPSKKYFIYRVIVTNVEFFKLFEEILESQTSHFK